MSKNQIITKIEIHLFYGLLKFKADSIPVWALLSILVIMCILLYYTRSISPLNIKFHEKLI